jgi:peptidoglycan hydrolase-like protein with peptidoglycan-binding domain
MPARISRLSMALFVMLSAGVALNMTVMQPLPRGTAVAHDNIWGAVNETAALAAPEIDAAAQDAASRRSSAGAGSALVPGGGDPITPGIGQRVVVTPPGTDLRQVTRDIQSALAARGYETGGTDGIAGPVTQAAILAYETDNGLPLTAEPSETLLQTIKEGRRVALTGGALAPGPKADALIRSVQTSLAKLGYKAGGADGRLGEATIAAIRAFEKQQAMPDTGRISGDLVTRLTRLSAASRTADKR